MLFFYELEPLVSKRREGLTHYSPVLLIYTHIKTSGWQFSNHFRGNHFTEIVQNSRTKSHSP